MQPFSKSVPAIHNYYCICPEANREREEVSYFIDWLIAEAGRGSDTDCPLSVGSGRKAVSMTYATGAIISLALMGVEP